MTVISTSLMEVFDRREPVGASAATGSQGMVVRGTKVRKLDGRALFVVHQMGRFYASVCLVASFPPSCSFRW
jgi:hypothetical protein